MPGDSPAAAPDSASLTDLAAGTSVVRETPPVGPDAGRGLAADLAESTRGLAAESDLDAALRAIVTLATASLACDDASITVRLSGGRFQTLAPTDDRVREADRLQYELQEGPCVAATYTDGIFLVEDLATDGRWPRWGPRAVSLGMHSIISVHLFTTSLSVGALNLYGSRNQRYTTDDVDLACIVAAHASAALARLRIEQDLWSAIDARHLIGQAQGVLMARLDLTTEEAFAWLQRCSQRSNRKLRDIADEIVRTRQVPDPASPRARIAGG